MQKLSLKKNNSAPKMRRKVEYNQDQDKTVIIPPAREKLTPHSKKYFNLAGTDTRM